jgi:hypothetical protein
MIEQSPRRTPLVARFFLGLFILWQILFLISSNLLSLVAKAREYWQDQDLVKTIVPEWSQAKGRIAAAEQSWSTIDTRWSELTGQPQNWSLFAPNVTSIIPFVAVEFCWEDDPHSVRAISEKLAPLAAGNGLDETCLAAAAWGKKSFNPDAILNQFVPKSALIKSPWPPGPFVPLPDAIWRSHKHSAWIVFSDNEPRDKQHYFKLGHFRLRRYESCIDISPASADKEPDSVVDAWREDIENRVRDRWRMMQAYMIWQLHRFMKDHPDSPAPRQLILWARIFRVPLPEEAPKAWNWLGPEWHPVARWQPNAVWSADLLPVEMYNPVANRFESVRQPEKSRHE